MRQDYKPPEPNSKILQIFFFKNFFSTFALYLHKFLFFYVFYILNRSMHDNIRGVFEK